MNRFKFLSKNRLTFPYEMTGHIHWVPSYLRNSEFWSPSRSDLIKGWLESHFEGDDIDVVKYFPEMDRTCRIIQTGIDTHRNLKVYTAKVWIMKSDEEYMEIDLKYPII